MLAFLRKGGTRPETLRRVELKRRRAAVRKKYREEMCIKEKHLCRRMCAAIDNLDVADAAEQIDEFVRELVDTVPSVSVNPVSDNSANAIVDLSADEDSSSIVAAKANGPKKRKRSRTILTWIERAAAIFCYLHPQVFNGSAGDAARVIGVSRTTFLGWVTKSGKVKVENWLHLVEELTWGAARKILDFVLFSDIPDDSRIPDGVLQPYRQFAPDARVLSCFSSMGGAARAAMARRHPSKFTAISKIRKTIHRLATVGEGNRYLGRKYDEASLFVSNLVNSRWHGGDPVCMTEVQDLVADHFEKPDVRKHGDNEAFWKHHLCEDTVNSRQHLHSFVKRVLKRCNFTTRCHTVSQKVPSDWEAQARQAANDIRTAAIEAKADVILNADQTFLNYFPETKKAIAPIGAKRVGTKVKANVKQGCTLMVTANYTNGLLANPFIVMTGKTGQSLDKQFSDWETRDVGNTCHVAFQKKHWFNADITIRYLKWLKDQFADKKIFLIWDHAPAHSCQRTQQFLDQAENEGWLVTKLIPGKYHSFSLRVATFM